MARKMMTKEVTTTVVQVGKIVQVDGMPTVEQLAPLTFMGALSMEKAQKAAQEHYKELGQVTVFSKSAETQVYEMPVEEFIKHATLKVAEAAPAAEGQV